MKTLVIVSHPYPDNSIVIKSLQNTSMDVSGVTVRNLEYLYGSDINKIDIAAEQAACEGMDRIVFMFPIHWFNITPMLKAYLNIVWTYGWAFGPEGKALDGKEMLVVSTAGATKYTYSAEGIIQCTIEDVLTPMKACALYVGMKYLEPLNFFEAMGVSEETLSNFNAKLTNRLKA